MRLIDCFDKGAVLYPDATAFIADGINYSYSKMQKWSEDIATSMVMQCGNDVGNVAVYSPNDVRAFGCILGTLRAGGVWVPLNARNGLEDNIAFLNTTKCNWLFYHSSFEQNIVLIQKATPTLKHLVCIDAETPEVISLEKFMAKASGPLPDIADDRDRLSTILATGGTTNKSKGVMFTNMTWEIFIATWWSAMPCEIKPVHLVAAPMTHAAGVYSFPLMLKGATSVVLQQADPLAIMEAIEKHRITHMYLPPTVVYMMLAHPRVREFDYSSLRYFLISAAPISAEKVGEAIEVFGASICQAYGQAEAPGLCAFMSNYDYDSGGEEKRQQRLGSCGRPTLLTMLEVMDDQGNILHANEHGEIVVRGNLVMPGYFDNPQATEEVSTFGWHHTGDIAYKDEDGFVYIVDRKKDMIITGGFNVFSTEVESVILTHPAIQDCAVVGVPDTKWGEAIKAVVELKDSAQVDPEEIIALCKEKLGSVKAPKTVEIWDALPRSPVGKLLKRVVRDKFWTGREKSVN